MEKLFKPLKSSDTPIGPHKIFLESQTDCMTGPCLVRETRPCGQCKNFSDGLCTKKNIQVSIDEYSPIWAFKTCFE